MQKSDLLLHALMTKGEMSCFVNFLHLKYHSCPTLDGSTFEWVANQCSVDDHVTQR